MSKNPQNVGLFFMEEKLSVVDTFVVLLLLVYVNINLNTPENIIIFSGK